MTDRSIGKLTVISFLIAGAFASPLLAQGAPIKMWKVGILGTPPISKAKW
jgi:hypothetical protein